MTFNEFINKNDGKPLDYDGVYGPQCMDLMRYYVQDVLALNSAQLSAPNAYQSWLKGGADFDRIEYRVGLVPQNGDIMYWNQEVGPSGHVAIFISGDDGSFFSFDQNWPVGTVCHRQSHNYKGVAGWLRKKQTTPIPNPTNNKHMITLLDNHRLTWKKDDSDNGIAEYWVIRTNATGPRETKHRVRNYTRDVAILFGEYNLLKRVDWGYLKGLTSGEDFDLNNLVITHPELFEAKK